MTLRGLALLATVSLFAPAAARAQSAPTGFIVPTDTDDDPIQKPSVNPDKPKKEKKKRARSDDADSPPPDDTPPARGLTVVEETAAAPTVIRADDLAADRAGKPILGAGKGIGFVRSPAADKKGSFTFKASAADAAKSSADDDDEDENDDDTPAPPARGKPASRASAPTSLVLPSSDDAAPVRRAAPDSDDDDDEAPVPTPAPQSGAVVKDDSPSTPVVAHPTSLLPAGRVIDGDGVKVEEVPVEYQRERFLEVGGKAKHKAEPKKAPKPEPAPAPAPVEPAAPAERAPEPAPEAAPKADAAPALSNDAPATETATAPEPASAPASTAANTPTPATTDPFEKLDREMRALEGKPPPEPEAPKPAPRPAEVKPREFQDPEFAEKPLEIPIAKDPTRDPSLLGLSLLAGAGSALIEDSTTGFSPHLAYGVTALINPSFAGPFALDVSLFRTARSGGDPFVSVDSAWLHTAVRLFFLKQQAHGVFLGFGGGLLLTMSQVDYTVNDGTPAQASGAQLRAGFDGSAIAGIHFGMLEIRADLRTLVRGGLRLDFLPTLSAGIQL